MRLLAGIPLTPLFAGDKGRRDKRQDGENPEVPRAQAGFDPRGGEYRVFHRVGVGGIPQRGRPILVLLVGCLSIPHGRHDSIWCANPRVSSDLDKCKGNPLAPLRKTGEISSEKLAIRNESAREPCRSHVVMQ